MKRGLVIIISVLVILLLIIPIISAFSFSDLWKKLTSRAISCMGASGTDPFDDCGACKVCNGAGSCVNIASGNPDKDNVYGCGPTVGKFCDGNGNCGSVTYTYFWVAGGVLSPCTANCGGGIQTRTVYCRKSDGSQVDESYCIETGTKPALNISCNTQPCSTCRCKSSCLPSENQLSQYTCASGICCGASSASTTQPSTTTTPSTTPTYTCVSPNLCYTGGPQCPSGQVVKAGTCASGICCGAISTTVDGVCGSAYGQTLTSTPTGTQLCTRGNTNAVITNITHWYWTCNGVNGGISVLCYAINTTTTTTTSAAKTAAGQLSCEDSDGGDADKQKYLGGIAKTLSGTTTTSSYADKCTSNKNLIETYCSQDSKSIIRTMKEGNVGSTYCPDDFTCINSKNYGECQLSCKRDDNNGYAIGREKGYENERDNTKYPSQKFSDYCGTEGVEQGKLVRYECERGEYSCCYVAKKIVNCNCQNNKCVELNEQNVERLFNSIPKITSICDGNKNLAFDLYDANYKISDVEINKDTSAVSFNILESNSNRESKLMNLGINQEDYYYPITIKVNSIYKRFLFFTPCAKLYINSDQSQLVDFGALTTSAAKVGEEAVSDSTYTNPWTTSSKLFQYQSNGMINEINPEIIGEIEQQTQPCNHETGIVNHLFYREGMCNSFDIGRPKKTIHTIQARLCLNGEFASASFICPALTKCVPDGPIYGYYMNAFCRDDNGDIVAPRFVSAVKKNGEIIRYNLPIFNIRG